MKLIARWPGARRLHPALLAVAGAAGAVGHVPFSLPLLTLLAFAAASQAVVAGANSLSAAKDGWWFGLGYFAVALSWVIEPFLVMISQDGWMAPFALPALAGGVALLWAAAFAAAFALGTGPRSRCLALALTVTATEMAREWLFTGFPWALPAYVWSETPIAQSLAYIGPHALTLATLLAAIAFRLFANPGIGVALAAMMLGGLWAGGTLRLAGKDAASGARPIVRIVQPNVPLDRKWDPEFAHAHFSLLLELTARNAERAPDLAVWPETAATFLLQSGDPRLAAISLAARGKPAVIGIRRFGPSGLHNSMAVIGPGGVVSGHYDKRHLVPFGEYVPLVRLLGSLGVRGLALDELGGFAPGRNAELLDLPPLGAVRPLICYEAIFPSEVRRGSRPSALLQITNDGWIGTISGPQQHFAQSRMRAIELGVPLIRAANTGISALVDGKGRSVAILPLGAEGIIDGELPPALPETVHARLGGLPAALAVLLGLAALGVRRLTGVRRIANRGD